MKLIRSSARAKTTMRALIIGLRPNTYWIRFKLSQETPQSTMSRALNMPKTTMIRALKRKPMSRAKRMGKMLRKAK